MNILLCLGTKKGSAVLDAVKELKDFKFHIITKNEKNVSKNYGPLIIEQANDYNFPVYKWNFFCKNYRDIIEKNEIKSIICIGWTYLIKQSILKYMKNEVIVIHDSLLPKYRGFSPLPSAIINGESETGITVLYASEEIDCGDIIYQKKISIDKKDTVKILIDKLCPLYIDGIIKYLYDLKNKNIIRTKQNNELASYSIWRDKEDYIIDWNQSAEKIERFVRALGFPYLGAKTYINNVGIIINEIKIVDDIKFEIRQPGKIWKLDNGLPVVVCGTGMILIKSANTELGENILPIKHLRKRFYIKGKY